MNKTIISIIRVLSSNILALVISIFAGLIIPKFLGIFEYALFRTYSLYISFTALFSFGFVDGMYLKYGGFKKENINKKILQSETWFFLFLQAFVTVIVSLVGLFFSNVIIFSFGLTILPLNMLGFYRRFFQAVDDFKTFSNINSIQALLKLSFVIAIVFLFKIQSGMAFITANIIIFYLIFIVLFICQFPGLFKRIEPKSFTALLQNIYVGVFIMLGNLSNMLFYSMDRWFVKFLLTTEDFAYYSFAVSMMSMVMILISSVAMTFYPMLAREKDNQELTNKLKTYLMILGAFTPGAYFFFDIVVRIYLPDYSPSLSVIAILFAGFPAIAVINAIYVNLYKAQKVEKKYFFTVIGMAGVSFLLNLIAVLVSESNTTIALATTTAFYFWCFYSSKDFKGTRTNLKEMIYLALFLGIFFSTTRLFTWWIGLPTFILGIFIITMILYKREFLELIAKLSHTFKNRTYESKDYL